MRYARTVEVPQIKSYPIKTKIPPRTEIKPNEAALLRISQKASLAALQKFLPVKEI